MMIDSVILLIHLRIDKINTTPESFGETNKRKSIMPGEASHGLQLRRILVLSLWFKTKPMVLMIEIKDTIIHTQT